MSEIEKGPTKDFQLPATVGVLFMASAILAALNHQVNGEWPAEQSGLVALAFGVTGVVLVLWAVSR